MYWCDHARDLVVSDGIEDFVSSPLGRCVVRPTYVVWCASPDLHGAIIWGVLDDASLRELLDVGRFQFHPSIAPARRLLVDCRYVTHVDVDAMLGFASFARERVDVWATAVERQAVIVPDGVAGILIGGALPSIGASHPLRFVHDIESALGFIDHPRARRAHWTAAHISDAQRGVSVMLARLHAHLRSDPSAPTVETAASALGMSTRTLQRELARIGTSFSVELRRVRVAAAESLLMHSDLKIDAIASKVGFGKASRMTAMLRRERNATASSLRARFRS